MNRPGLIATTAALLFPLAYACAEVTGVDASDPNAPNGSDPSVDGSQPPTNDRSDDAGSNDGGASEATTNPAKDAGPPVYVDVSTGVSGPYPSAAIDTVNGKLLFAAGLTTILLFRCNLDGSSCTRTAISTGSGVEALQSNGASLVIDAVNAKALVVVGTQPTGTTPNATVLKPSLFRCNLDGTSCTHTDISAGQPNGSGYRTSAVIDAVNAKLLAVTTNFANGFRPSLFRCNLDGTGCTHSDISSGATGHDPSPVIDAANGKLVVVAADGSNGRPNLFRCSLDGTSCTASDLSIGTGVAGTSGQTPSAVIDAANGKLLVATRNLGNMSKPSLFRCNLDGTACAHTDISAGQGTNSGWTPSAVLDPANASLLVVTRNGANADKPGLFRCNVDGTGCAHTDVSAGQDGGSGGNPSAVLSSTTGKLLVVTNNGANNSRPGLFLVGL